MTVGWLPGEPAELFGEGAEAAVAYEVLTVDVPAAAWQAALTTARDTLGCTYFDWLSAVDEPDTGFRICAHVVAVGTPPRRLLLRATVPHEAPSLPTATGVYAGASWHERETHEMFGVDFPGHPGLTRLLLPDAFEGHPLRKDFVLAARVAKAWPGAKEPGESGHGGPARRRILPPGVPDPNEWGPLKGQLPAGPARRARKATEARPPRRTRTTDAASTSQRTPEKPSPPEASLEAATEARPPRRPRTAGDGSASRRAAETPSPPETPPGASSEASLDASPEAPSGATPEAPPEMSFEAPPGVPSEASSGAPFEAAAEARPPRRARTAGDGSASRRAAEKPSPPEAPSGASSGASREASPEAPSGATPEASPEAPPEASPEAATPEASSEASASREAPGSGEGGER
ncbi:NADH-quinone oxidoreductase subunit C [Streptomyces sp. SBT349]|uniref:NADH-quinone oxidoreductase subunit C n=1 Tax=Streptomyces sp. SBT349 TaxID=1580539 RepID=UPI00099BEDBB|nr:NADH-quinone oxidoreductase subunit C [Streptomyces sp. SBT349]